MHIYMYRERERLKAFVKKKSRMWNPGLAERERVEEANTLLSQRAAFQSDFFIKQIKKD